MPDIDVVVVELGEKEAIKAVAPPDQLADAQQRAASEASSFRLKPSDYISFTALLISAAAAFYGLLGWFKGAIISFIPPEAVSFECYPTKPGDDECGAQSILSVRAGNMTYVNEGRPEYGAVLVGETVTVRISSSKEAKSKEAKLHWSTFSNLNPDAPSEPKIASAQLIPGASAIAHETVFYAREEPCSSCDPRTNFVPWAEFVKAIADPSRKISLSFSPTVRANTIPSKSCDVFLSDAVRNRFQQPSAEVQRTTTKGLVCVASK